ncbi:hypothetical protein LVS58_06720 [Pseudomonas sp. JR33AA]|nr:hypothetical protein [Pseudomonas sp. JR33AA]
MDDTTLAFMIFAANHPDVLAQVKILSEAEALEAGEPLSALRDTMVVQTLTVEADMQGVSLPELVQKLIGGDDPGEGDPSVPGLEKYNRMRDFNASPEPSGAEKFPMRSKRVAAHALHRLPAQRQRCDHRQRLFGAGQGRTAGIGADWDGMPTIQQLITQEMKARIGMK